MVWNCSITGRSGLTFQEALESEAKARKKLSSFPDYLQKPILFLASTTHKSRLNDLNDDVFTFAKDHFFLDEIVDVLVEDDRFVQDIGNITLFGECVAQWLRHSTGDQGVWGLIPAGLIMYKSLGQALNPHRLFARR